MLSVEAIASSVASGFLLGGILALTALGLSIVLGVMRLVNLAHGVFLVAGAYLAFFLLQATGIDPIITLIPIGVAIAIAALPVQRFLLEPLAKFGPEAPMMTTFGLAIVLENLFVIYFSADTRSIERDYATVPLALGPVSVPLVYVIGFVISVCAIVAVHFVISRTAFGRDLRASAVDPCAAAAVGVDVRRVHALTFALGAACAACRWYLDRHHIFFYARERRELSADRFRYRRTWWDGQHLWHLDRRYFTGCTAKPGWYHPGRRLS